MASGALQKGELLKNDADKEISDLKASPLSLLQFDAATNAHHCLTERNVGPPFRVTRTHRSCACVHLGEHFSMVRMTV